MDKIIRDATVADLVRVNEIYNEYIVGRHTSFDEEPWTITERQRWFTKYNDQERRYRVLVLESGGRVVGFASSSLFKDKAAYSSSVETTMVLGGESVGRGWGGLLLGKLIDELTAAPVHRAYALIALPNEPSVALHHRHDYRDVGVLDEVGYKMDRYHSVLMMERSF